MKNAYNSAFFLQNNEDIAKLTLLSVSVFLKKILKNNKNPIFPIGIYGRSRKNSTSSRQNMSRTSSNSNLTKQNRHHGSSNNIPRANLGKSSPPYERQISLHYQPKTTTTSNGMRGDHYSRPHTAACDTTDQQKQFEWPKSLSSLERRPKDEPLPSDMEVMLSDVENLR